MLSQCAATFSPFFSLAILHTLVQFLLYQVWKITLIALVQNITNVQEGLSKFQDDFGTFHSIVLTSPASSMYIKYPKYRVLDAHNL
jgi:hypothetical protein